VSAPGREDLGGSKVSPKEAAAAVANAERHLLGTLRVRSNLLRRLRATLDDVCTPADLRNVGLDSDGAPEALVAIAEFVLLPLILILQKGVESNPSIFPDIRPPPQSHASLAQERSLHYIRRTAQLRCVEDAAVALATYIKAISGKRGLLDSAIVIRCLVACTMSLSSVEAAFTGNEKVGSGQADGPGDEKKCSSAAGNSSNSNDRDSLTKADGGSLDAGDECRLALLRCISVLFGLAQPLLTEGKDVPANGHIGASGSALSQRIADHMDGALLIRIIGGCMTVLENLVAEAKVRDVSRCNLTLGLATLDSLQEIIDAVPDADIWRKVLPGAFAGLFKLAITSSRVQAAGALSSSKLGAKAIRTISFVLGVSLSSLSRPVGATEDSAEDLPSTESSGSASAMASAAAQLLAAATRAGATTASTSSPSVDNDDTSSPLKRSTTLSPFLEEVNVRLPVPLKALLGVCTVHRSASIKRAGICLCTALLVDTRDVWSSKKAPAMGENSEGGGDDKRINANEVDLERAALECCLSLLGDNDPKVASEATGAIKSYRKMHSGQSWKETTGTKIVPRLLDLTQGLPTLARSGRDSELRCQIRLVAGYLMVSLNLDQGDDETNSRSQSKEERKQRSEIASALACESVSSIIRMSLTELFRLDYNTVSVSPQMPSKILIDQGSSSSVFYLTGVNRFRYLRHESSVASAMEMLRFLGMALGAKRGALFVDGCIAELCDAARGMSRNGKAQICWLDQWAGLVVLSKEILASAFVSGENVIPPSNDARQTLKQCTDKKSLEILQSLVSSILPVVTRPPLWTLPTTVQIAEDESRVHGTYRNEVTLRSYLTSPRGLDAAILEDQRPVDAAAIDSETSASAFCGNAILIGLLMELIGTISVLLGESIRPFLPTILYPVLENTSAVHHHHVQQAALLTLEQLSQADGCATVTSFISKHFDYLVDSVTAKLRRPGGVTKASVPYVNQDLFHSGVVELLFRSLAKEAEDNALHGIDDPRDASHISLLADLLDNILVAYDDSIAEGSKDMRSRAALGLLNMFEAALAFLSTAMAGQYPQRNEDNSSTHANVVEPWVESLAAFKLQCKGPNDENSDDEEGLSAREGFERHHASKEKKTNLADSSSSSLDNQEKSHPLDKARIASAIASANSILSRCCYLLSVHDLKVERASCEVMISAFRFLAPAERAQRAAEKEDESNGYASLMSISNVWPSIVERLKMTSQELRAKDCRSSILNMSESQRDTALVEDEVFVAKLFELVTCMCQISGDFMVSRFEHDVWPIFAQLIGHEVMLREQQQSRERLRLPKNMSATRRAIAGAPGASSLPKRRQRALLALLDCIARCFGSKNLGVGLTGLVSRVGTVILPLLADEGEVGDAAAVAVQALLAVDSDALWRPLLVLSGGHVPPRLLKSTRVGKVSDDRGRSVVLAKANVMDDSTLMKRAKELMQYADDLPEQVIV